MRARKTKYTLEQLAQPLGITCANCGEHAATLWPYPMPRGTCTCPCSSPPELVAFVKAMSENLAA